MPTGLNNSQLTDFAPAWVSEPDGRGTWKVLYSCVLTLFLCVFTAIHLNVGPAGETTIGWWIHKCKWVGIAILSPELVLYSAGKQWFSAGRLCKKLNALAETYDPDPATVPFEPFYSGAVEPRRAWPLQDMKRPKYTMLYGHFAVMGGFVVDVSHLHNSLSRVTISPKGIAFLARHGHFLRIPESTIRDKSKADILAKVLVCGQVAWMLVQTIGRKAVGYPITLLEVHTLVHVACAIAMYGLWFQKPLDVRDPAWVEASAFQDLLALMLVRNYGYGARWHLDDKTAPASVQSIDHTYQTGSESSYLHVYPTRVKDGPKDSTTSREAETLLAQKISQKQALQQPRISSPEIVTHQASDGFDFAFDPPTNTQTSCRILSGQSLPCGIGPALNVRPLWGPELNLKNDGRLLIPLSDNDIRRWNLAATALIRVGEELHTPQGSVNYFTSHAPNIFIDRKGLQAGFYAYFCAWASGGLIAALVLCCFFGGCHILAWNFEFPTSIERRLWRIACIDTIVGTISLLAMFSIVIYLHEHNWKSLRNALLAHELGMLPWIYRLVILFGVLNIPFFLLSRVYIIVETFISLRRVPLGVYATVDWAEYIPHL
ncbi:hypothetical protein MMC22_005791 [Lobaria immixta]|nr:hypothetical protein [Lobaria immixta]